jgi:GTP-binding protein
LKITSSRFERAAFRPADEPQAPGPDVVFLGRSNVGKSSLINRMLGAKNLARTSSRPGRTQSVNFYRINESLYFVDLPGYGWARVPETVRRSWKPMVEACLQRRRQRMALALLVVDSRHAATELDLVMREWLETKEIPYVVAATKSDKLSASERARSERAMLDGFGAGGVAERPLLVSVRSGSGIRELWRHVDAALEAWWERVGVQSGAPRPVPR